MLQQPFFGLFLYALIITLQGFKLLAETLGFLAVLAFGTVSIVFRIGTGLSGDLLIREKPMNYECALTVMF